MARVKRWTVPFMSFNGTSCHVDIFDEDWTGSVTTLIGAANPFEYEEDNDEDLLNGVLRYRSGYLRIVEETYGDLDALYPATNTDRYIEFYYGENLDFVGFIMAQEFDNDWVSGPRVIELPVVSPLGLAAGTTLDWTQFVTTGNVPSWFSIRMMINRALTALNAAYAGFYFPKYTSAESYSVVADALYLNTLTVVPFGNNYIKTSSSGDLTGIYDPMTVADLLTMICTGFGCILHDGIDYPVFQRVDWDGDYVRFGLTAQSVPTPQTVTDVTAIASVASADNMKSVVQPLSKITVTYDGDDSIPEMTMNRCRGEERGSALEDYELCTNTPNISDFVGSWSTAIGFDANGQIAEGKIALAAAGSGSLTEQILYRKASDWSTHKLLGSYTFFEWWGESSRLQFSFKYGESIDNMNNPEIVGFHSKVSVAIYAGSHQLAAGSWSDGREICEVGFLPYYSGTPQPLTVEFYCEDSLTEWICSISDVKIVRFETEADNYLERKIWPKEYKIEGTPSFTEGSLTRGFGIWADTTHKLRYNSDIVTGTIQVEIKDNDPQYPYLTQPQERLLIDVKTESYQQLAPWYMNRQTLWSSSKKWRCIARSFRPWDDAYRLTFHHSPIFEY